MRNSGTELSGIAIASYQRLIFFGADDQQQKTPLCYWKQSWHLKVSTFQQTDTSIPDELIGRETVLSLILRCDG